MGMNIPDADIKLCKRIMKRDPAAIDEIATLEEAKEIICMIMNMGLLHCCPFVETDINERLQEIISRVESEVLNKLSDSGEDWFTATKVNEVLNIIRENILRGKE